MTFAEWAMVGAGIPALAVILYFMIKNAGRQEADIDRLNANEEARHDANKRMDDLSKLSDDELNRRL